MLIRKSFSAVKCHKDCAEGQKKLDKLVEREKKRKLKYTVHKSSMATDILKKIKHRWAACKFAL